MLRTTAVVCSLLLLGCAELPAKPVTESAQLNVPAGLALAGLTDGSDPVHPVPIADYDKAQCFKPRAWEQWKVYIKLLELYAERHRQ